MESYYTEGNGGDHFTVSVEFEQADSTGHHHANKMIQLLTIDPE
jgi:hypothetical protein